jgi:hypothetical protein
MCQLQTIEIVVSALSWIGSCRQVRLSAQSLCGNFQLSSLVCRTVCWKGLSLVLQTRCFRRAVCVVSSMCQSLFPVMMFLDATQPEYNASDQGFFH